MMEEREARENADIVLCSGTAGEGLPKADLVRMAEMFPDGTDLILVNVPNRDGMIVAAGFMARALWDRNHAESVDFSFPDRGRAG